jgi:hypothetical protein
MSEQADQTNINIASKVELLALPGIGNALAERIIDTRPFSSLDGLKEVEGIGDTMLEQLIPLIKLSDSDDSENPDEAELPQEQSESTAIADRSDATAVDVQEPQLLETAQEDAESSSIPGASLPPNHDLPGEAKSSQVEPTHSDADEFELDDSVQEMEEAGIQQGKDRIPDHPQPDFANAAKPQPKFITRGCAFWLMLGITTLSLILSVIASLGILVAVNGGLEYVSPREFMTLKRQVDGLTAQVNRIDSDLDDLFLRMENLESLSGRLGQLENNLAKLQKQNDINDALLKELSTGVDDLTEQVEEVKTETNSFSNFLEGLRKLLAGEASS